MKLLTISIVLIFGLNSYAQSKTKIDKVWATGMRCLVAHTDNNGVFTCDFNGTYYPEHIRDTSITKWLVKNANGKDSVWYYRRIIDEVYVWDKNKPYGYVMKTSRGSMTMYENYNGKDTLIFKRQVWQPKK